MWEVVNKKRRKKRGGCNGIGIEEWENYFKKQLGEVDLKVVRKGKKGREGRGKGYKKGGNC